ncbi:MAG: ABC transporter ATP-binding protein [Acidimicrobiia bacterium]
MATEPEALEHEEEGNPITTRHALRRAIVEAPSLRHGLITTVLLAVLGTIGSLIVPVMVQQVVDRELLSEGGPNLTSVLWQGAIAIALLVIATFLARSAVFRLSTLTANGLKELRVKLFDHLHRLSILHVQSERRGALVSRVTSDITTIQEFMEFGGVGMLIGVAQVLLALVVMFFYRWQLAALVSLGVIIYIVMLLFFQSLLQRAHDQVREKVADSLSVIGEAITGLPVIRAHGVEESTLARVKATLTAQVRAEHRAFKLSALLFASAELFAAGITATVIGVGILLGAAEGTSAGVLLAFLFLVNLMIDPVQTLVETIDQAQRAAAGLRRVLRVLDTPIDIPDPVDGVELRPGPLDMRMTDVTYRYPNGPVVLTKMNVEIPSGKRVAVVGQTGSGKTTFAKLVARLLAPDSGGIEIGGISLPTIRFASLRQRVAFVPQEGFLFNTSIANNVRYGAPGATDQDIRDAFAQLGLEAWLERTPSGLETEVGERGTNLSAGERQLVALVRAWISKPDLLVLDEATSAVDPFLEVSLRRAIERLTTGRTSITVAHRLSTAEASDEVLVFDHGGLVERGNHHELLASKGVYTKLYADWDRGAKTA